VVGLSTVSPNWGGIVDGDGISGEITGAGSNGHETGVKPSPGASRRVGQGHTGGAERRLGDSMVLSLEDELDGVPRRSADTTGTETECSVATNDNLNGVSGRRGRGGSWRVGVRRISRRPHIGAEGDGTGNEGWRRGRGNGSGSVVGGPSGTGRILSVSLERGTNRQSGVLEVGERVGRSVSTTIDGVDHATAAVAARSVAGLRTEYPNWIGIGYIHSERRQVGRGDVGTHWHETRVKATIFVSARTGERRLGHSMVLGVEVVDNLVARIREDCLWRIGEVGATDLDINDLGGNGRSKDKTDERGEHGWQVRMGVG